MFRASPGDERSIVSLFVNARVKKKLNTEMIVKCEAESPESFHLFVLLHCCGREALDRRSASLQFRAPPLNRWNNRHG